MSGTYASSKRFVRANDLSFHYALDGAADAPLLALINMASHNLTSWEPVMDELTRHFQVLRFDIRGTGKSAWGDDAEFTFPQYADDLAAILTALDLPPAFVVGVAYGARTAARFALRHPQRLYALGLFDVSLKPPVAQDGQRALGAEARALLEAAGEPAPRAEKWWRYYEDREAARKAHTAHQGEPDLTGDLGAVMVPTLVACGRQDMNLEEARRVAGALPHAEFAVLEMTGHGSPLFRPALFARLLTDFALRHGASGRTDSAP